jgi:hypothetical protein
MAKLMREIDADRTPDLYRDMCLHSSALWYVHPCGVVSQSRILPSREQLIQAYMSIPTFFARIDERGYSVMGEPHYPTREEAERSVGNYKMDEEQAA